MSIPLRKKTTLKLPTWVLFIGLFGIVNFLVGCWFLLPPNEGRTIFFWFAEFYGYILLPSLIVFPVSIIIVALWFSRFTERSWAKVIVTIAGVVVSVVCFVPAFGAVAFVSTLHFIGRVQQNKQFYYLVKHYDDNAPSYSFCESDTTGFSGQCMYIGWKGDDNDPKIYIAQNTNLVTVESENPSFIWMNSFPPRCVNDFDENAGEESVGGCAP